MKKNFEAVIVNPKNGKSVLHVAIKAADKFWAEYKLTKFINAQTLRPDVNNNLIFRDYDDMNVIAMLDELKDGEEIAILESPTNHDEIMETYVIEGNVWESIEHN